MACREVVIRQRNLRYASLPGNVRLRKGEGNLPKTCVANVTQIQTIDRAYLIQKIGTLHRHLLRRVWDRVRLVAEVD